jgi:hypothetical protein
MSAVRLSQEERQAKLDTAHQRLVAAVGALRSSADWLGYLAAMGRFHRYSASGIFEVRECPLSGGRPFRQVPMQTSPVRLGAIRSTTVPLDVSIW